MLDLSEKQSGLDLVTIKDCLEKSGNLDVSGGVQYLAELLEETSSTSNVDHYAKIIKEKSTLRKLIHRAEEIVSNGYQAQGDVRNIVDEAEASIFEIAQSGDTSGPKHIKEILHTTFANLEKISQRPSEVTGLSTGFTDLDKETTGLHRGELIIVAGRPAMGKTTFGLNIVQNICIQEKAPCLIFSLEMTEELLVQRMLCAEAGVDGQKLRTGRVRGEDWSDIARAASSLSLIPLHIDDTPSLTILEMRSRARRIKSRFGLELVMIDYLQLMEGRGRVESRQLEISEISRSLKFMAKELDCPVVALSQLSRAVEAQKEARPMLSHLRESGSIEQDADVVLMLYRPEYYKIPEIEIKGVKQNSDGLAEVIISKQRNGPTGSVFLAFQKSLTRFMGPNREQEPPQVHMDDDDEFQDH